MNKKKITRLLGVFLSLIMVLGMMPVAAFAAEGDVAINDVNFPDAKFRAYVKMQPGAEDDVLTPEELAAIKSIEVQKYYHTEDADKISDLTGIEHFTSLEYLDCSYNLLTSLDVTKLTSLKELYCSHNNLTSLDVSKNALLINFSCQKNQLTQLDVSALTKLEYFDFYGNSIESIDLSNNTLLEYLECDGNGLTTLDVSNNTLLTALLCYSNNLTYLDVSNNVLLDDLECDRNRLTQLDVSNLTELTYFDCYENKITYLDVSNNPMLNQLDCDDNCLAFLDVSNNPNLSAGDLYCDNNDRIIADVTALQGFDITKATVISGGNFDGGTVNFDPDSDKIEYTYDIGNGSTCNFVMTRGAEVTFKIEGGTWDGLNNHDIVVGVPFVGGANAKGTLDVQDVPVGMMAAEGFEGGAWDVTPDTEVDAVSGNVTYTYSFTEKVAVPPTDGPSTDTPSVDTPSTEDTSVDTPSTTSPLTGESSSMLLVAVLSFATMCGVAVALRKKKNNIV